MSPLQGHLPYTNFETIRNCKKWANQLLTYYKYYIYLDMPILGIYQILNFERIQLGDCSLIGIYKM